MKDKTEKKIILKKSMSHLELTWLTYNLRYEIKITHRKKSRKNHET